MRRFLARAALMVLSLATLRRFNRRASLWIDRVIVWGNL